MSSGMQAKRWRVKTLGLIALLISIGCGGQQGMSLGKVNGKITLNGAPVTMGTITLVPIGKDSKSPKNAGRPATCTIQTDGTFTATTTKEADGAVVGRHQVMFSPPEQASSADAAPDGAHKEPAPVLYGGLVPSPAEIEIKAGENSVTIELKTP